MNETNILIIAFMGGIVPALFWLWFWIREDRLRPEPKIIIFYSFAGGILAVLIALFTELIIYYIFVDANPFSIKDLPDGLRLFLQNFVEKNNIIYFQTNFWDGIQNFFSSWDISSVYKIDVKKIFLVVIIAPIIEELFKLIFTYNFCLRRKVNDEPIDASIYLLTSALGFAAVETALFLIDPLTSGNYSSSLIAGNFRSIGPMLIHLISSAMLGIFIGFAFYKSKIIKFLYLIMGFLLAVFIHALFNFFIMLNENTHDITFFWIACFGTWILVVVLLILFEKIKKVAIPGIRQARKK